MERLVRFKLLGHNFSFYTDASEDDVKKIISLVKEEVEDNNPQNRSTVPSSKTLILACLQIASRYIELKRDFDGYRNQQDERIDNLISKVSSEI